MTNEELLLKDQQALARSYEVLHALIDPEKGCPWDRTQTPLSLCEYVIEETHEMVDAIRSGKPAHACDEMGDLLFLIIMIARHYAAEGKFTFGDALLASAAKMTRRHPHVFGDAHCESMEDINRNWAEIKKAEKEAAGEGDQGVFGSVPTGLPPLTKAYRLHSKAATAGFTWDDDEEVERQVEAEWLELLDAKASGDEDAKVHELGDMILSLVELGRRMGIKAAHATDLAANRFRSRFEAMEALAKEQGKDFASLDLDGMDELWNEVKAKEAPSASATDHHAPFVKPEESHE